MKNLLLLSVLFFSLISCTREEKFPELKTQLIQDESLQLERFDSIPATAVETADKNVLSECINDLMVSAENYRKKSESFSLDVLREKWEKCRTETDRFEGNNKSLGEWIKITGLLLQLTAETKYAAELERIVLKASNEKLKRQAASYVITKNVDHLHLNLFLSATAEYEHSLGGKVKVEVETKYPDDGKTQLKFNMEEKRYIELQIRIPHWANDAQVTVKGVKYFAPAGDYCFIAKKWKEGDLVEIVFPSIHNHPVI